MKNITDIWFKTELDIEILSKLLGISIEEVDAENYWEWVIGSIGSHKLDVTRTHTLEPGQTDTRIFRLGDSKVIQGELYSVLIQKLRDLGISPIHAGKWNYDSGNEYEKCVEETIT